jgi:nicotinamide riboside kinase
MIRIALVGPECSGKTTLALLLAKKLSCKYVPEFARIYLNNNPQYEEKDLLIIAKAQHELIEKADDDQKGYLIIDTELTVIKIWSEVKYGHCHAQIEKLQEQQRIDFYLLMYPDLPWEIDVQRESKDSLLEVFNLYKEELLNKKRSFAIIKGLNDERDISALGAISKYYPDIIV